MLFFPIAVFLLCCSTILSGYCNSSFYFLNLLGVMELHNFAWIVCMDRSSIYTFDNDQPETRYSVEYIHVVSVVNALCRKKYPVEYNFIVDICKWLLQFFILLFEPFA